MGLFLIAILSCSEGSHLLDHLDDVRGLTVEERQELRISIYESMPAFCDEIGAQDESTR